MSLHIIRLNQAYAVVSDGLLVPTCCVRQIFHSTETHFPIITSVPIQTSFIVPDAFAHGVILTLSPSGCQVRDNSHVGQILVLS